MKVCNQTVKNLEFISGINENIRIPDNRLHLIFPFLHIGSNLIGAVIAIAKVCIAVTRDLPAVLLQALCHCLCITDLLLIGVLSENILPFRMRMVAEDPLISR